MGDTKHPQLQSASVYLKRSCDSACVYWTFHFYLFRPVKRYEKLESLCLRRKEQKPVATLQAHTPYIADYIRQYFQHNDKKTTRIVTKTKKHHDNNEKNSRVVVITIRTTAQSPSLLYFCLWFCASQHAKTLNTLLIQFLVVLSLIVLAFYLLLLEHIFRAPELLFSSLARSFRRWYLFEALIVFFHCIRLCVYFALLASKV